MSMIICKIGEIKATDKGDVIVKFTSTSGAEFAGIMGMMKDLMAVTIVPVTEQGELDLDEEADTEPAPGTDAPAAPPEQPALALESGEVVDAEYQDVDDDDAATAADVAGETGPLDDEAGTGDDPDKF